MSLPGLRAPHEAKCQQRDAQAHEPFAHEADRSLLAPRAGREVAGNEEAHSHEEGLVDRSQQRQHQAARSSPVGAFPIEPAAAAP